MVKLYSKAILLAFIAINSSFLNGELSAPPQKFLPQTRWQRLWGTPQEINPEWQKYQERTKLSLEQPYKYKSIEEKKYMEQKYINDLLQKRAIEQKQLENSKTQRTQERYQQAQKQDRAQQASERQENYEKGILLLHPEELQQEITVQQQIIAQANTNINKLKKRLETRYPEVWKKLNTTNNPQN